MKIEGSKVIFSSGKERYAYSGIIGLSPEMNLTGGYDDRFWENDINEDWEDGDEASDDLSSSDLIELADYMIEQWGKFKAQMTIHPGGE